MKNASRSEPGDKASTCQQQGEVERQSKQVNHTHESKEKEELP